MDSKEVIGISVGAAVAATTILVLNKTVKAKIRKQELKNVAAECIKNRDAKVHKILKSSEGASHIDLHQLSVSELKLKIEKGEIKPSQAVAALAIRCSKYGGISGVNAITEEFYDEAFESALELDSKNSIGLLHGIPISVKDCIGFAGALQTGGLACRSGEEWRCKTDSFLVELIRKCGALPMVRGNVSQCMMMPESANNVFGRTDNPWDLNRTPGGSSGGEAALVSAGCVPLAIGTDVGGSVRIPSAFCGVVGFKSTPGRISKRGCMSPRPRDRHGLADIIPSVIGPIAKSVDDCALFMRAVLSNDFYKRDVTIPPFPFNEERYNGTKKGKTKIGYFVSDGWFEPCRAAQRGIKEVVGLLKQDPNVIVEEIKLPVTGWDTYKLYVALVSAEGNMRGFMEGLDGEELHPLYEKLRQAANLPNWLRPFVSRLIDERRGTLVNVTRSGGLSVYQFQQHLADLVALKKAWAELVEENEYDAILHPSLPLPAFKHGTSSDLTGACSYTMLANLLLWPEGCVPVTTIREEEQCYHMTDLPENQRDQWARNAAKLMEGSKGLPLSVSVMCPPFRDEECLRIMKKIESIVNFSAKPTAYLNK